MTDYKQRDYDRIVFRTYMDRSIQRENGKAKETPPKKDKPKKDKPKGRSR